MADWQNFRLGDLCAIKGGKRLPIGHNLMIEKTNHPYIKARDIKDGRISTQNLEYISDSTHNLISKYIVKKDDVCLTIVANIGDVGIVTEELNNANLTENALRLTSFSRNVYPQFLNYLLSTGTYKSYCELLSAGAAQAKLGIYKVKTLNLRLPPISEQKSIASILSAYDDLIENNNKRIAILEQMAEQIYREWFVRMRFPGYENAEFEKGVPKGWNKKRLSDIVTPQYGYTESAIINDDFPNFLRVTDINKRSYITWEEVPNCVINEINLSKYRLNRFDIVMARMADPGKIAIIEKDISSVFASYLIKLKLKNEFNELHYFLFYTLSNPSLQGYFAGTSSGSTRATINAKTMTSVWINLPPEKLIRDFTTKITLLRELINILISSNNNLRQTRDLLLPRLISGKLRVKDIEKMPDT
ncbi:MAG: restriction endonuclease subunit S [Bacteroidales bacterium]|nr:restriction endonuclease subunit S [Bacteroidales bacterium]